MSGTPALYQSANSSTSTLRPRNTRLISYLDDDKDDQTPVPVKASSSTTSSIANPALFAVQGVSPLSTVSRTRSVGKTQDGTPKPYQSHNRSASANAQGRAGGGLWNSWSSIQDTAFAFLANDSPDNLGRKRSKGKKPEWMKQDKSYGVSHKQKAWGPSAENPTASKDDKVEERQALVQAKKREALLLSTAQDSRDALGRYKRKDSGTFFDHPSAGEFLGDILVYRHTVASNDTLAGVTIKYSCQPEVFRKVNRFWPNDNIQRRKYVLLPVEACSIRGRKVDAPKTTDLLDSETQRIAEDASRKPSLENSSFNPFPETEVTQPALSSSPPLEQPDENYKHDSWVSLPSFSQPVEILRISRHTLGYFPPARRKSNPPLFVESPASTPKSSFDLLRHPPTHAAQQAQLHHQSTVSASLDASPTGRPSVPSRLGSRMRSSSTASAPGTSKTLANALRGPGGVGTLRGLRTEAARPGPADDPLNKKFAQYIPDLMPPDEELLSANFARTLAMSPSLRATPRASTDSIRSSRSNSSTMPAAIEGWMRKIAGNGTNSGVTSPLRRRGEGHRATPSGSMGDLIELESNTDSYFGSYGDDDEQPTPRATPVTATSKSFAEAEGQKTDEELLNDRFPIKGRIQRAYETK